MNETDLKEIGRQVFQLEIEALSIGKDHLDENFLRAVDLLDACKGKVIITGLGKSGIAGMKISATLSSTGMPSLFLHSGEAGHGDLGVVAAGDVVIALSYSGETQELTAIIPRFKFLGVPVIALTGNPESALAEAADVVIDVAVPKYPWPYGLLPTASNAITVAVGDALAIALLMKRGIREDQFAKLHPGGLLGRKMLVKVDDIMHRGDNLPLVRPEEPMRDVLMEMTAKRLGVACVVDDETHCLGVITDGDLRRLLGKNHNPLDRTAESVMTVNPKTIRQGTLSAQALSIMERNSITSLIVTGEDNVITGIIHMHDILRMETAS